MIPGQLDLGTGTEGHLTLTAADGPVSWSASTTSGRLTLSSSQGTLQAGQSVTLTVTVNRNAGHGGNASVVVGLGSGDPGRSGRPGRRADLQPGRSGRLGGRRAAGSVAVGVGRRVVLGAPVTGCVVLMGQ